MKEVSIIGLDVAKNSFQLHRASADGAVVFRKKLSRNQLPQFLAAQPRCVVAMEACSSAHHWGRKFEQLGHDVRLIAPIHVKPKSKTELLLDRLHGVDSLVRWVIQAMFNEGVGCLSEGINVEFGFPFLAEQIAVQKCQ